MFQVRLVKALRLELIGTLHSANTYLDEMCLDVMNDRFHLEAKSTADVRRRLPLGIKLEHVLAYREGRVVQNDWTVS